MGVLSKMSEAVMRWVREVMQQVDNECARARTTHVYTKIQFAVRQRGIIGESRMIQWITNSFRDE